MSAYDIARIISTPALRETGARVPAKPVPQQSQAGTRAQAHAGPQSQGGVSVETGSVSGLAGAGEAPVDNERVAQIRVALEQGTYPIKPAKIADAMIAARLMLSVSE
jgi:negative regulator of flagellin synthesis FlgM